MAAPKKSLQDVYQEKSERLMEGVAYWGSFYRQNPQRFVKEYLNITLKLFQKILIYMMIVSNYFMYIASRGSGKTWLVSLYCVVRCILYPGSKICIASARKEQSLECIQKIEEDFMKNYSWGSANLRNEISFISSSVNKPIVEFKNGSWIKCVVSSDSARHNRANIIVVDEFRMVDLTVINTVLRKFLTAPRQPGYLKYPQYQDLEERNCEIYMSSAWYKQHWSYRKLQSYFVNMLDANKKYFCCGLPYQLALKEGLLNRSQVEYEMSEEDFDPISWSMEMGAEWYGDSDGSFFKFDDISPRRKIKKSFYPLLIYKNHNITIPDLEPNEERILSVDVALMASKKHQNDASALTIGRAFPTDSYDYIDNIVYQETHEGLTTDELGLIVMRSFYQYKCTQLVLDTAGSGIGIYDFLIKDQYDPEYGITYLGLNCCNNDEMADRCKNKNAEKLIWAIKANSEFNSKAVTALRAGFQNGKINLLINEFECEDEVKKIRGYSKMTPTEQAWLKVPYIQTSYMINELVNLEYSINGNQVKVKEKSNMRKDRFSSIEYQYYVVQQLGLKLKPNYLSTSSLLQKLTSQIRPSKLIKK